MPSDVVSSIKYLYNGFLGRNFFAAVEYSCPPIIKSVDLNRTKVITCSQTDSPQNDPCLDNSQLVEVSTTATDPDGDILLYQYHVTGGKITGSGSKISWDLSGVKPGAYTVSVWVDDGCGVCVEPTTKEVKVIECKECRSEIEKPPLLICPRGISIKHSQEKIRVGEIVTFTLNAEDWNGVDVSKFVFNWTISNGEIIGGQRTKTLSVKVPLNFTRQIISATVDTEDGVCLHNPPSATVEVIKPQLI